jgi:REP element-mobilizing transposase RayT
VHVTWRLVRSLPSLRLKALSAVVGRTMRAATQARGRSTFRIVHFSIQDNHLHLVVEAGSKRTLMRGLRALAIRLARRLNQALGRRGQVLAERYHARPVTTPREMRNLIVCVLHNHRHHRPSRYLVDEHSSARWFNGWATPLSPPTTPSPVSPPGTWLSRKGWRRHGLIRFDEQPADLRKGR